jgi:hypothetical protein
MRLVALAFVLGVACDGEDPQPDAGAADMGIGVPGDTDGDEWPEDVDSCPGLSNPEQRDRDRDGIGDACDTCPSTPNDGVTSPAQDACSPEMEAEPNDDVPAPITLETPGRIREIRGTIEAGAGRQAVDRFAVMIPARTLLMLRVARARPESLLEPSITVTGGAFTVERYADGAFAATRQIYAAETGLYEIAVTDRRGTDGEPRGADTYAYALAIETEVASPEPLEAPFARRPFVLEPAGTIGIYEVEAGPSPYLRIATETDLGLGATSGLDTILIVEREGEVIENDDIASGFVDARVVLDLERAEVLRVTIDHRRAFGSDLEVRLTIDEPPTNEEVEPNDVIELASQLVFPGETIGRINEPADPDLGPPDVDWYRFDATAGQIVAITGLIPANSQVDPILVLSRLDPSGRIDLYENLDSSGLAPRIEAILHEAGPYAVGVADQRNDGPPPFVGSNTDVLMRYGLYAEPVGLQPEAVVLTSSGALTAQLQPGGRLVRHLVIAAGPTILAVDTTGVSSPDVEPFLRIYGPNLAGLFGEGLRSAAAYLPMPETYVVAVHNGNAGKGDPSFTYDLFATLIPIAGAVAETEPNDTIEDADDGGAPPAAFTGELTADDTDVFRIALAAGQTVTFAIGEGRAGKNLLLYDGTGAVAGGAGRIAGFTAASAGDHFVSVAGAPSRYTLVVF